MADDLTTGIDKAERLATAIDAAVEPADEEGNRVIPDNARVVRWAGPLFGLCAVVLVPWIVITSLILPSRQVSENFDVAWAGYDAGLFIALVGTAVCALKRSRYLTICGIGDRGIAARRRLVRCAHRTLGLESGAVDRDVRPGRTTAGRAVSLARPT